MFGFNRNREIHRRLESYYNEINVCIKVFMEAIIHVMEYECDDRFETLMHEVHHHESQADDIRRQIETDLFAKSLLPETRKDLMEILERLDQIPNRAEWIVNLIYSQNTPPWKGAYSFLKELISLIEEAVQETLMAVQDCFGKMEKVHEFTLKIDHYESQGDLIQQKMMIQLFQKSSLDKAEIILQKELLNGIAEILDLCEKAVDQIALCAIKRQV